MHTLHISAEPKIHYLEWHFVFNFHKQSNNPAYNNNGQYSYSTTTTKTYYYLSYRMSYRTRPPQGAGSASGVKRTDNVQTLIHPCHEVSVVLI